MSQRWISTIETKEDYVPRHANLVKLAAALSTDIAPFYVAADLVKSRVAAQKLAEAMDVPVEDPRFGIHKMIGDVDIEDALSLHDLGRIREALRNLLRDQDRRKQDHPGTTPAPSHRSQS